MRIYLAILFFVAGITALPAQTTNSNAVNEILALVTTNHPAAPTNTAPKMPRGPTTITADGPANFDLNGHWVTYADHVVVSDAQTKLTCEWLMANLPQGGEHATNVVAETNVVVDFTDEKGQQTHATGDKAVYSYHVENGITNETVTLTGNPPKLQQGNNVMTGTAIIWDRGTGHVTIEHPNGVFWQSTNSPSGTNSATQPSIF
jgi:lipopolysaccharide export system protein LptA